MNRTSFGLLTWSALLAASAAQAAPVKTNCARGGDARVIEVLEPGVVGQSCDVKYTRGAGNVSVPYHADNSDTFCNQKAREMVQRLTLSGFTCATAAPALRAEAAPAPTTQQAAADYVVEVRRPADAPRAAETETLNVPPQQIAAVEAPAAEVAPQAATELVAAGFASDEPEVSALEEQMNEILTQPVAEQASGAPAQLVAQHTATSPAAPQPSAVGRLVGAAPEIAQPAVAVTQASAVQEAPAPKKKPATEAVQTAPAPVEKASTTATNSLRSPADVVRATLMAQAAAWNEGDLDGFMNGYWKSDELKFVSGGAITRGWDATLKRYRERYAGGGGLGKLGFEKLEVKLVTNDVAVVTGRFLLSNNGENSSGMFSLVMRRDNGAWRIVHDHTNADPKPASTQ